jgi:hypothetical protein
MKWKKVSWIVFVLLFLEACKNDDFLPVTTELVLIGERHDYMQKFEYQLKLIQQIHAERPIAFLLVEQPYSTGTIINKLFENGDSLTVKEFLKEEGALVNRDFKPLYQFYLNLYSYWESLASDKRFALRFIDAESVKESNIRIWMDLLRLSALDSVRSQLDKLRFDPMSYTSTMATVDHLRKLSSDSLLMVNHPKYLDIIEITRGFSASNRDSLMALRIHDLQAIMASDEILLGQFGAWHTCKTNVGSLAQRLYTANPAALFTIKLDLTESGDKEKENINYASCGYDHVLEGVGVKGRFLR